MVSFTFYNREKNCKVQIVSTTKREKAVRTKEMQWPYVIFNSKKNQMDKVTAEMYQQHTDRYTLVSGHQEGAPTCSFGNVQQWVGYDKTDQKFIRFTKSVFKILVQQKENETK